MNKIVFLGAGPVAAESLKSLVQNFEIELVITKSRKHARDAAPVEDFATEQKLPMKFASNRAELDDLIADKNFASRVAVIVDYGVIVSQKVIDKFPLGIINSHFSLLPEWRGADPISFAILSGQTVTGVSLMIIEPTLDTGKLIAQKTLDVAPDDTTPTLTDKLVALSNNMLAEFLPQYVDGKITPFEQQNPESATYSRKLTKADGNLDPATMTATECEHKIRAFIEFPRTRLNFHNKETIVTAAQVLNGFAGDDWPDVIKCADDTFLQIKELINPKSGKKMKTADYLRGLH
ncbi:MAG: methionyl-tRNA formyltransferase [Candidatus Nomurabacteria bacterium]|jgi:methionyl-tRNA formyltransferase|nr:methionyl-tRNA formyltransferase [Candidatus Nomurabacteria bacterium]